LFEKCFNDSFDFYFQPSAVAEHFFALSTNKEKVEAFGIVSKNMFGFWDSLWSAIDLSICLSVGYDSFEKLLGGAFFMDNHFKTAPLHENVSGFFRLEIIFDFFCYCCRLQ
jgi:glucose-6-phosphate isomerase